jgi:hypothetical protein
MLIAAIEAATYPGQHKRAEHGKCADPWRVHKTETTRHGAACPCTARNTEVEPATLVRRCPPGGDS